MSLFLKMSYIWLDDTEKNTAETQIPSSYHIAVILMEGAMQSSLGESAQFSYLAANSPIYENQLL